MYLNSEKPIWDENGLCKNTENLQQWIPIGSNKNEFCGIFDGNGYKVCNMYIDNNPQEIGLFGRIYGGTVRNINVIDSYLHSSSSHIGGVVGFVYVANVENCTFDGLAYADNSNTLALGGITGSSCTGKIIGCTNNGIVRGRPSYEEFGEEYVMVGGICGEIYNNGSVYSSVNNGIVSGNYNVGGIIGKCYGDIYQCCNIGNVDGICNVGGIVGTVRELSYNRPIENCYNMGVVTGTSHVGGIAGNALSGDYKNCYAVGNITGSEYVGSLYGYNSYIWGEKAKVQNNYYFSENSVCGCGNCSDENEIIEALNGTSIKAKNSFVNWNFDTVWAISPDKNGGYPYLQWQEDILGDISVNGVSLGKSTLELKQGDKVYLTAIISPTNATIKTCTWTSSEPTVASVDDNGKVVALSAGTATITVTTTDGGFSATCDITVAARSIEEYTVDKYDLNGDGVVNAADLTELARVVAKIDTVQYG